jgi:acetyl esterase/lipase
VDPHPVEDEAHPTERVILYAHGGGYTICSRKTHRGLTWRLSKATKSSILC